VRAAERIRYLALAVQREGNRRLTAELRPLGLTPAQSEVLRILGDHAPMTLTALGRMLVCESGTNPSRLVDKLVGARLVWRVNSARDRREISLTLSDEGARLERAVRTIENGIYAELESTFGSIDVGGFIAYLEMLVAGQPAGMALAERIAADTTAEGTSVPPL
jgi:MarR family transcriptional regulator, organic hydroperoxide resistance regulator